MKYYFQKDGRNYNLYEIVSSGDYKLIGIIYSNGVMNMSEKYSDYSWPIIDMSQSLIPLVIGEALSKYNVCHNLDSRVSIVVENEEALL